MPRKFAGHSMLCPYEGENMVESVGLAITFTHSLSEAQGFPPSKGEGGAPEKPILIEKHC